VVVSCVDTLKFVAMAVAFDAVVLPKTTSRPAAVGKTLFIAGPNRNDGNPNVVVFVIDGVTLATVTKLSG
jgi:hypothetical protein